MLVLDTDHLSEMERNSPLGSALTDRLHRADDEIVTTIVSAEELLRGWLSQLNRVRSVHKHVANYEHLAHRLAFCARWHLLPWDSDAAALFDNLRRQGIRGGTMDLKIACITITNSATLLSRNLKDFRKIPGLIVVEWL